MSSPQPPTLPTAGRRRRTGQGVANRPELWVKRIGLALCGMGLVIMVITGLVILVRFALIVPFTIATQPPLSAGTRTGLVVGGVIGCLGMFVLVAVPGALVALRHPWGDGYRLVWEQRYAHPRLAGLTLVWDGVVLPGWLGAELVLRFPLSVGQGTLLTWAVILVAVAPWLAIILFDRR